jgi:hypothetical protein
MHLLFFRKFKINHLLEYDHAFILGPVLTVANSKFLMAASNDNSPSYLTFYLPFVLHYPLFMY